MMNKNELNMYDKLFDYWKNTQSKTTLCEHAIWSGGPGYTGFDHCEFNADIRYGCKMCPETCDKFELSSESMLMSRFNSELSDCYVKYLKEKLQIKE